MKKVLIAKDLKSLFPEKGSFLDRQDVKVFFAETNDEAQRICSKETIDLIVTQLDLADGRAEDLCEFIRTNPERRKASIIMICQDTLAHRERSKRCRANAVLTMPVDRVILHLKMQEFLNVAPRMLYRAMLAIAIEGKFRDRPVPFWTENLSASGMLIKAAEPLSKGAGVFLSFFLPDGTHISGYGEIVRVSRYQGDAEMYLYGIKFTNVDREARTAIELVIRPKKQKETHT